HGTTPYEIVRYLNHSNNVTLVTASIPVMTLAIEVFNGKIIFVGGEYEQDQKFTSGPLAEMILQQMKADKVFVAAGGISLKDGVSDYDLHGASISKKMIQRAENVIVLADSSKFGKTTFVNVCSLSEVSKVITDKNCSAQWIQKFEKYKVDLLITNNEDLLI
ncbi:MAG TPA: DeoR/GlpR family DNA-binding transcription regulator, partial [Rummeliibacillus sp.]|nr:DeoR/GlpR family DNA-binding transcription regulator [Rummeliibacillus sp.]